MKRIPTLLGSLKFVFTLAILLLRVGSATAQTEVTLPASPTDEQLQRARRTRGNTTQKSRR